MVLLQRQFWSKAGGGSRRWLRLKTELFKKATDGEHIFKGPVTLFDFGLFDDAYDASIVEESSKKGGWRISDDEVIGGFSRGKMNLIRAEEDLTRVANGETIAPLPESPRQEDRKPDAEDFTPFIRWHGTLDTRIGQDSKAQRSGFCAVRSPEFPYGACNLATRYNALEFLVRTDGRPYTVNLKVTSFFPDDLYQNFIRIPPNNDFVRVILPFRDFLHTSVGRVREVQRILDGSIQVENIGLTLMDGKDGDFQFDLARIRAINYYNGMILGEDDEDAPY